MNVKHPPFFYNFWLLNIAAYITLVTVAYPIVTTMSNALDRVIAVGLFTGFALLLVVCLRTQDRPLLAHGYLLAQTCFVLGVYALLPAVGIHVGILFFVLSAQSMLFLPMRQAMAWIAVFFLITFVAGIAVEGWSELFDILSTGGGYIFFGTFGASLRQANAAQRQSQRLFDELTIAHQQLQEYAVQARQLAVSEERNRLAREMHDSLGHRLTVAVVQLEGAQRLMPTEPERAAQMVSAMRAQLKEALAELRQAVSTLRQPAASAHEQSLMPLDTAVLDLTQTFEAATGLSVQLTLPPDLPDLPAAYRLTLYRAMQESLTNVHRHADATQVWLDLALDDGSITLTVADNGQSFPDKIQDGRFGLRGLQERMVQLGGQLYLETRAGGGAQIRLQLPIPA